MTVSVVVPLYREARRIPGTLPRLADALAGLGRPHEVILVAEPSGDGTAEAARGLARENWRVLETPRHRGKGGAVRAGMAEATGDVVCYLDADMSTDPEALSRACERFGREPDLMVVCGDRRDPRSRLIRRQGGTRAALGRAFNVFARILFPRLGLRDTQCGFKAFRREAARAIFERQRIDGFAFDVEVLLLARDLGLRIATLPVTWTDASFSTVRVARDGLAMLRDCAGLWVSRHRSPRLPDHA